MTKAKALIIPVTPFQQNCRLLWCEATKRAVVIDPTGYIVTNNHVIEDSDQITVSLQDGTQLPAKVIGRDTKTDLALLKVDGVKMNPLAIAN